MAKRYVRFEELSAGTYKPNDTLGRHHCTVTAQGDKKVVVGSATGSVTLKAGDTLGYDCGKVWVVPSPDSYRDPIRRVLALARVPQRMLQYSAKPVEYTKSWKNTADWPDNSACDSSTGESVAVLGDSNEEKTDESETHASYVIKGGDAIVTRCVVGWKTAFHQDRKVVSVVVRPTADKKVVAEWLFELLTPEGQEQARDRRRDREFLDFLSYFVKNEELDASEIELAKIGDLYRRVGTARKYGTDQVIAFQGVNYKLTWSATSGFDPFWFESPGVLNPNKHGFVEAMHSGLLATWLDKFEAKTDAA